MLIQINYILFHRDLTYLEICKILPTLHFFWPLHFEASVLDIQGE